MFTGSSDFSISTLNSNNVHSEGPTIINISHNYQVRHVVRFDAYSSLHSVYLSTQLEIRLLTCSPLQVGSFASGMATGAVTAGLFTLPGPL